jgi:hypothetical protein
MTRSRKFSLALVTLAMGLTQKTVADAVVDWNVIASQVITAGARPGPASLLDFAMVHAAIYDAVEAIDGRFKPYYVVIPGASGSPASATAKAAHDVLVNRFPAQAAALDATYSTYLASNGLADDDPGVLVGQVAAAGIIALRANDGSYPPNPEVFIGGTDPGEWRPTPGTMTPMLVPWFATVTPFTLREPSQFRAPPPLPLDSSQYTAEYNEVKTMGALVNSARTPEQTDFAYFFADNAILYWNRALQGIASTYLDNIGDSARLFALVTLAMADAGITAWDSKRLYHFWRPVTAIQNGDNDLNPYTAGDPNWLPLITTPSYPEYTSGANNVSGSATRMLQHFFGTDEVSFSLTSNFPKAVQKTRAYSRFSDAADDVMNARIYEGIHFRTADVLGRRQGEDVADWAFKHILQPLHEGGHHGDHDDDDDGHGHH